MGNFGSGSRVNFRRWIILLVGVFCLTAQAFVYWLFGQYDPVSRDFSDVLGNAERGAYIAKISGCTGCHTNWDQGGGFLAGGRSIETVMGVFFPPNVTSDKNAGIGLWDLKGFANALTRGVSPDGSHYYPAFPYWSYANLTDQDIADLWEAFQTSTPSATPSIAHQPTFPLADRRLLASWKRLNSAMIGFTSRPDRSQEWNRGAYLAMGPGQCMSCHAQESFVDRLKWWAISSTTEGVRLPAPAPNLDAERLIKRSWSKRDMVAALRSGTKPSGEGFAGEMASAVANTTSHMSESDLSALATYLLWQAE